MVDYHRGERAVQDRAGLAEVAGRSGRSIRTAVPDVAAAFLAGQPVLFLGAEDGAGRLWTTMLAGEPGFLGVPDPHTVTVAARPVDVDPLGAALAGVARVGMIAIEPSSRRRMRVNGVSRPDGDGLVVAVEEVVANCPKYIQRRDPVAGGPGTARVVARGTALDGRWRERVTAADTFFVTTAAEDGRADTSHRGGGPGFVRVLSPTVLEWPDYVGNAMFLTLGNLAVRPDAGLLFPDWVEGAALHLSGTAVTDWSPEAAARHPGARRVVRFTVSDVVEVGGHSPYRWSAPEYSRFNPESA
ncbi:pyridoxamine 5'-phosphate oxidase family protein [Saccharothrix violaceirubra]|uniref:Pyridoxamine 5'-phosphate oxidase putative domain-containing protein n=1 Tax=Saccharothrix violaceirubra TaxID=413306 RepID=A0A7W7WVQ1_9PSEU|nr:pyridoxamine 5'-phosphate oxidase family protein [Saccharothrix violaceirubra]MBB4964758.1 hypothetical protein [Saccharothrix violaceirubra]